MQKEKKPYTQMYLAARVFAGGYLLYTAWKLREAVAEKPLFLIPIVIFAVLGAALFLHAGWKLYKGEYEGGPAYAQSEDPEEAVAETEETEEL